MTHRINAVYLSGWEYNRVLQQDPCVARNSALPGEILWNGSAQLWLFEKVYCTQEALDNERAAGEILGWATGKAFSELAEDPEGWFEPVRWDTLLDQTKADLRRKSKSESADVRAAIRAHDVATLERVKSDLLQPVLAEKRCVLGVAPNSLRNWALPAAKGQSARSSSERLAELVKALERPLRYDARDKRICQPPCPTRGELYVRQYVEGPLTSDLFAGENEFAGPRGYEPYFKKLEPYKNVYQQTDCLLWAQWKKNHDSLKRLRFLASKYLWKDLHEEWLPELYARGEPFLEEFHRRLQKALRAAWCAEILDTDSRMVAAFAGSASVALVQLAARVGNVELDPSILVPLAGLVGIPTYMKLEEGRKELGSLALFYNKARSP